MSKLEKTISLGAEIVELRSQRAELDEKISQRESELKSLISPAQTAISVPVGLPEQKENESPENKRGKSIPKGELKPGSVADRVLKIMKSSPDSVFSPDELVDEESGMSRPNVANALSRLAKNEQIVKVGHGQYQAKKRAFDLM